MDVNLILSEAAERIRKEAYDAGWRDAFEAVRKFMDGQSAEIPAQVDGPAVSASIPANGNDQKLPTQGTTPYYIVTAVRKRPGMNAGQIIDMLRADGHTAPEASIRTNIHRMKERKLIVLRHGKWFPS